MTEFLAQKKSCPVTVQKIPLVLLSEKVNDGRKGVAPGVDSNSNVSERSNEGQGHTSVCQYHASSLSHTTYYNNH